MYTRLVRTARRHARTWKGWATEVSESRDPAVCDSSRVEHRVDGTSALHELVHSRKEKHVKVDGWTYPRLLQQWCQVLPHHLCPVQRFLFQTKINHVFGYLDPDFFLLITNINTSWCDQTDVLGNEKHWREWVSFSSVYRLAHPGKYLFILNCSESYRKLMGGFIFNAFSTGARCSLPLVFSSIWLKYG